MMRTFLLTFLFLLQPLFSSLPPKTLIQTIDGLREVCSLNAGDKIIGFDLETNNVVLTTVTSLKMCLVKKQIRIITNADSFIISADQLLRVKNTSAHLMQVVASDPENFFVPAQNLAFGDELQTLNGLPQKCLQIEAIDTCDDTFYELHLESPHHFFITTQNILLHNSVEAFCSVAVGLGGVTVTPPLAIGLAALTIFGGCIALLDYVISDPKPEAFGQERYKNPLTLTPIHDTQRNKESVAQHTAREENQRMIACKQLVANLPPETRENISLAYKTCVPQLHESAVTRSAQIDLCNVQKIGFPSLLNTLKKVTLNTPSRRFPKLENSVFHASALCSMVDLNISPMQALKAKTMLPFEYDETLCLLIDDATDVCAITNRRCNEFFAVFKGTYRAKKLSTIAGQQSWVQELSTLEINALKNELKLTAPANDSDPDPLVMRCGTGKAQKPNLPTTVCGTGQKELQFPPASCGTGKFIDDFFLKNISRCGINKINEWPKPPRCGTSRLMEKELEQLLQKNGCNQRLQSLGLANAIDTTPNDTDRIRTDPAKKKHVLRPDHYWELVSGETWDQVVDIIDDVMKTGADGNTEGDGKSKYKYYEDHLIVVKYGFDEGINKIGTAFVCKPKNKGRYIPKGKT